MKKHLLDHVIVHGLSAIVYISKALPSPYKPYQGRGHLARLRSYNLQHSAQMLKYNQTSQKFPSRH